MRILHVSDLHLPLQRGDVPLAGWFGKRIFGLGNLLLGRGKVYRDAGVKIEALDRFRRTHDIDLVLCTGDYTALGAEKELARARAAVAPLTEARLGFVTVAGNHDLYVKDTWKQKRFEHHFASVLASDLPDSGTDGGP